MKRIYIALLALGSITFFSQCKNPSDGLKISINPVPFDYTVAVKFYDAATPGTAPKNIKVEILGESADAVYEISGKKVFTVVDGIISLGVLPNANPSEGTPTRFIVKATADGYLPVSIPVRMGVSDKNMSVSMSMINLAKPPAGVTVKQVTIPLVGGAIVDPVTVSTESSAPAATRQDVSVDIPAGTTFQDADGNTLTGSSLEVTVVSFGTATAASMNAFPGGGNGDGFFSETIVNEAGNTVSGILESAGFANIIMEINGVEVKTFSQPVTIHMGINNSQPNPTTGALFSLGDEIPVWSYSLDDLIWRHETGGVVTAVGGVKEVSFPMTHLTYFNLDYFVDACNSATLKVNTNRLTAEGFILDIYKADNPYYPIATKYLWVENGATVTFLNVPEGNVNMRIYPNTAENSLYNYQVRQPTPGGTYSGALCGGNASISIAASTNPAISFDIEGQCPGSSTNPFVRPTVDVWYRAFGSNTEFELLGKVVTGYFTTTSLAQNTRYDFKVVWAAEQVFLHTRNVTQTSYDSVIVVPEDKVDIFCN